MEEELCLLCPEHQLPPPPNSPIVGYQPPAPRLPRSGLAIAALVVGIVSLALCWVPILNNAIFFVALVALGLGIAGIVITKRKAATHNGFEMAVAGVILAVVSIIGIFATPAFYSRIVDSALDKLDSPSITSGQSESTGSKTALPADKTVDSNVIISIVSLKLAGGDYKGNPTAILTYTVTNNTDENFSVISLSATAFQNGTSLDNLPFYKDNPEGYDSNSLRQKIQPGATGTVTEAFKLKDETTPVKVEIEDRLDFSNDSKPVTQEFTLQ